ncbi:hypothetical protein N7G274_003754 [Stereocaulon virgatum]|uniref:Uncharacterized protein n=1 Tax=Stereocaulon virgatum TaxID=373712 RepID=A0ABR4AC72_9LECA
MSSITYLKISPGSLHFKDSELKKFLDYSGVFLNIECDAAGQLIQVDRRKSSPQATIYQMENNTFTKILPEQAITSELMSHG